MVNKSRTAVNKLIRLPEAQYKIALLSHGLIVINITYWLLVSLQKV